jgi:DNA-binding MarR family transcriptional regulator
MTLPYADIYRLVDKMHRLLDSVIQSAISGLDLTIAQFQLLEVVASGKATSPSRCSQAVNLTPSGMTNILDKLESRGLVVRTRENPDRRLITIELLPEGQSLYQSATLAVSNAWIEAVRGFSKEDSLLFSMFSERRLS